MFEIFGCVRNHGKECQKFSQYSFRGIVYFRIFYHPGDFRSWESPQTLPALFIGHFNHVERFRNLKFAVIRITKIQSTVLSSSEGTAAVHLTFK